MTVARVPLVNGIYGAAKKVLAAFQTRPEGVQRVVLIGFPSRIPANISWCSTRYMLGCGPRYRHVGLPVRS